MENNNEKRRNQNSGSFILMVVLVVMAVITIFTMSGTGDWGGVLTNLGFLAIMAFMIVRAEKRGFRKMLHFADKCKQIQETLDIHRKIAYGTALWEEMQNEEIVFEDEFVDEKWNKYMEGAIKESADIYLDEDEMMSHFEKSYCDMVPGLLTALGILGTFLGLIFSMGSFALENEDALQNALGSIVSGMNVAFYTSVYGVALSIIFNLVNRNCQKAASESLYELCLDLNTCFKFSATKETTGRELLKQGESSVLELRGIKSVLRDELAKTIGYTISEQLEPVFKDINRSLDNVIGDFRMEQAASLQFVAQSFVEEMKKALDSHIDELGQSVDRLSLSQNSMTGEMKKLLGEIGRTAKDTKKINAVTENILQQFELYLGQVNDMVTTANQTFYAVEEYAKEMSQTSRKQHEVVCDLAKHEKNVLNVTGNVESTYTSMKGILDDNKTLVSDMGAQMEGIALSLKEQVESLQVSQENLSEDLRRYAQGTMDVFMNMKEAQLTASAQYQKCLLVLEKLIEQAPEKAPEKAPEQEPQQISVASGTDREVLQLLSMQAKSLDRITSYLEQQEKRRQNSLSNRVLEKIDKICNRFMK